MKIRPEAAQRLEQGLQKRIDERKRRFAAEWQSAVDFGRRSGLGQAIGIFRAEIHPPPSMFFFVRVFASIAALPLLIIAAVKGVPGMSRLLIFAPFLISGWIAVNSLLTLRNRYTRWLFAYADGFTEFNEGGEPDRPTRWDDFTDVADSWSWVDSEVGSSSWSFNGLELAARGGTSTPFNAHYDNMLDPYHPVNRMLTAFLPSTVGAMIPQFPTILEILTSHLVRRIIDRDVATVHAGGVVERAGVRVTKDGLIPPGEASMMPWAEICQIDLTPKRARIQLPGGGRVITQPITASAGPWMLSLLLNQLRVPAYFRTSI